jgi:NaMN:DMB phosphoribosyltransferase
MSGWRTDPLSGPETSFVLQIEGSRVARKTKIFCKGNAISEKEVKMCIDLGREETNKMIDELEEADVIMFGEVGIGNTTTASALIAALTGVSVNVACMIDPMVCRLLLFATKSTEKGQMIAIEYILEIAKTISISVPAKTALDMLDMGLRLGETSGLITNTPLLRSACSTFGLATLNDVLDLDVGSKSSKTK